MSLPPPEPLLPDSNSPSEPPPIAPSPIEQLYGAPEEPFLAASASATTLCEACGQSYRSADVVQIAGRNICANCKPDVLQSLQQGGPPETPPIYPPPPKLRVWTVLVMTVCALLASVGSSTVVLVFALFKMGVFAGGPDLDFMQIMSRVQEAINRIPEEPWGSVVLVLPGQLTMLGVVIAATLLARRPLAARLGYTRSLLPWRTFPLLLAGTFFAAGVGGLIVQWLFPEPTAGIKMIETLMKKPSGAGLASLVMMVCVLPPLCEEALFRGYLQRRLLQRWHPAAAIAVSTVFFTTAHFDPEHVLAVVPLAVWLGVVAWRTDSLWPSMICHCAQNSLALLGTRLGAGDSKQVSPVEIAVVAVAGVLTVWAVMIMRRHPVPSRAGMAPVSAPVPSPAASAT